ncbi:unnamed protein product, partial [Prorocentrum cordatum]
GGGGERQCPWRSPGGPPLGARGWPSQGGRPRTAAPPRSKRGALGCQRRRPGATCRWAPGRGPTGSRRPTGSAPSPAPGSSRRTPAWPRCRGCSCSGWPRRTPTSWWRSGAAWRATASAGSAASRSCGAPWPRRERAVSRISRASRSRSTRGMTNGRTSSTTSTSTASSWVGGSASCWPWAASSCSTRRATTSTWTPSRGPGSTTCPLRTTSAICWTESGGCRRTTPRRARSPRAGKPWRCGACAWRTTCATCGARSRPSARGLPRSRPAALRWPSAWSRRVSGGWRR